MTENRLDDGAAITVVSFAVLEVFRIYRDTAPSLGDIRLADRNDWDIKQKLIDADVMSGIIVVLMGFAAVFLMNKRYPLLFLLLTWFAVAGYYHLVQQSPHSYTQAVKEGLI